MDSSTGEKEKREENEKEKETVEAGPVWVKILLYAIVCVVATLITYFLAFLRADNQNAFYAALTVFLACALVAPLAERIIHA